MEPREIAERLEQRAALPAGEEERFTGYAVMGVPFASGHVLALRHFPASSLGPGYTSVWQRDPEGRWVFCQDVPPEQGCSRYFGSALDGSLVGQIRIVWSGPREFTVSVEGGLHLNWQISLTQSPGARLLNAVSQALPGSIWQSPAALRLMGKAAGALLGAGRISLVGQVPNGQRFIANPRHIWTIASSPATLNGQDLGPVRPLPDQESLGDFWIPQRGIFAAANAFLETFDPARHAAVTAGHIPVQEADAGSRHVS
jgi:hypothetical protein